MRDWVTNLTNTHYLVGSAIGPAPFPTIVRDFQSVIGTEIKTQLYGLTGKLPDAVIACVGGGSNAIGTFHPFINDKSVRIVGVEAAGEGASFSLPRSFLSLPEAPRPDSPRLPLAGVDTEHHSATISRGTKGVFHGVRTYILQSAVGQIMGTHSISAGLDYPGVGPEHAWLHETKRGEYTSATDEEALRGFRACTQMEGIIPALETSHAVWATMKLAKTLPKEANIVMVRLAAPFLWAGRRRRRARAPLAAQVADALLPPADSFRPRRQGRAGDLGDPAGQVGRQARLACVPLLSPPLLLLGRARS